MFGAKFWEGISGKVAEQWVDRILSPALVFWGGGFLAYALWRGWDAVGKFLQGLDATGQILFAVGGLILVAASAKAVEEVQLTSLRFLEGHWPRLVHWLRRRRTISAAGRLSSLQASWASLAGRFDQLTTDEQAEYVRLDAALAGYPSQERLLPTELGNRLRAAEDYPRDRYGLATGVVWPRLWMAMPEAACNEITVARERLNAAVRLVVWSALFLAWLAFGAWWAIPLALVGMAWGYARALDAAGTYGELLRAAFDVYRDKLYQELKWPPAVDEKARGEALTLFLWRG